VIKVDRGNGIEEMEESLLDGPHLTYTDNEREYTEVVEYRLNGQVVHRSVHVKLKQGVGIEGIPGLFS
jgi:hypothetical protein